jgi:thiol-disulfide isomerase/thioredoxin
MKLICIAAMALLLCSCHRKIISETATFNRQLYTDAGGRPMLLGIHKKEDLQQPPYKDWFDKNYAEYKMDSATARQLNPFVKNKQFEIFMGTWCGDSKREVPRMFKLLEYAGVQASQIKLVMVDNHDSTYKQSPAHEEKGKDIHRVPDLLVYDHKREINRIVESPVVSIEQDLLAIVKGDPYQPNYKGASYLLKLTAGNDMDRIIKDSIRLEEKLKPMVQHSGELNTLGYVWMAAGKMDKALMVFRLNAALYPHEANVYDSLGEINMKLNNKETARKCYLKVLELEPANANAVKMLAQLN